jgi:hydrogenase maturation protein HypF
MTTRAPVTERQALSVSVTGVVQGVGFRPFVHRLAIRHGLAGWVRNQAGEVKILIEGSGPNVQAFLRDLQTNAPPLTRIDSLEQFPRELSNPAGFSIVASTDQPDRRQPVSPDVAICEACETELFDSRNRRHRYPFVTCTDCGPRYTVIEAMPYDRERTSMSVFQQCSDCTREYVTPGDRRYHSETNSCHACGPSVWLEHSGDDSPAATGVAAIESAADLISGGKIVAVRGLGGFHLACDATNEQAVVRLRERKCRESRPLAVMVRCPEAVRQIAELSDQEELLLASRERPIVLLRKSSTLAPSVSPGLDTVGVMTAYTPLHHLLLDIVGRPLVMTSGNRSEEPIAIGNEDARARLSDIADAFLFHDREIVARYDDSVIRLAGETPVFLRRARGYAPLPVTMPVEAPRPIVAVGPHLKNTFTLAHERTAYVSQHIGDLENLETLEHFRDSLDAFSRLFRVEPEVVVRDLHPGYLSTRIAEELGLSPILSVQHHHAHIAAVAAEHGITDRVIGVAYDGTGYGDDGAVWGAEIMVADLAGYERCCHLRYAPLPGGDVAVRQPWRSALGYLSLDRSVGAAFVLAFRGIEQRERVLAEQQIERDLNAPLASSMGRLFDAAAAVLGTRQVSHYEGQAAMEFEAMAATEPVEPLPFPILDGAEGSMQLDPVPLLAALGEAVLRGDDVRQLAGRFHESVATATCEVVRRLRDSTGITTVALSGGVFQNARLLASVSRRLSDAGFNVLVPRLLSPNDGAISYGQAAVAAALLARGEIQK